MAETPVPPVQTPGRCCDVCGIVTPLDICPVDGSVMATMEVVIDA